MEMNKNTLELKTARDEPALTYSSHVLEAVMLKAANESIKMLSISRTTTSWVRTMAGTKGEWISYRIRQVSVPRRDG